MRRPPVVLIVVAVMLAGVGVGWAAQSGSDHSVLVTETAAPADTALGVDNLSEPDVSSAAESAAPEDDSDLSVSGSSATGAERQVAAVEGEAPHLATPESADPAADPEPIVTTSTTTVPVVTVAFSATQAYGSCDEPIPYDIFSGNATPGTKVTISSAYGSGSTTADGNGHWERKVEFPSAPRGETFSVTASGLGGSKTMSFTAIGSSAEH